MKEYATLIVRDLSYPYDRPTFSRRSQQWGHLGDPPFPGTLEAMQRQRWQVVSSAVLPKVTSDGGLDPHYAFILEREVPA